MNGLVQPNEDLPSSMIAAQLVDNLTRGNQQSGHQYRADFENLLQIFEAEQKAEHHAEILDDAGENAKLIDVVTKAGLDPLFRENPFEAQATLVKQASRSLGVINATLRKCPRALFFYSSQQEADPTLCSPLYLWLVPNLIVVGTNEQICDLRSAATKVLHTVIVIERKMSSKVARLHKVHRYILNCIRGRTSKFPKTEILSSTTRLTVLQIALHMRKE